MSGVTAVATVQGCYEGIVRLTLRAHRFPGRVSLSESVFPAVPLAIDPVFVGSNTVPSRRANPTLAPRSHVSSCRQLSPWQLAISPMNSGLIAFPSTTRIVRSRKHFSVAPISKHRTSTSSHHDFSHESSLSFLPRVAPPALRVARGITVAAESPTRKSAKPKLSYKVLARILSS